VDGRRDGSQSDLDLAAPLAFRALRDLWLLPFEFAVSRFRHKRD
jgi:hypothetical protein